MHVSLKNTSLKTKEIYFLIFLYYYGIVVYDEISNREKSNVKDTRKGKKKFSANPWEPEIESQREALGE